MPAIRDLEDAVAALETNCNLSVLDLSYSNLGESGAARICDALEKNITVPGINLSYCKLGESGAHHIAKALQNNRTLTSLDLRCNHIADKGVESVAIASMRSGTLATLDVSFNGITDRGADSIACAVERSSIMIALDLRSNHITDTGADRLAAALEKNASVTMMDVSYNSISHEAMERIAASVALSTCSAPLCWKLKNTGKDVRLAAIEELAKVEPKILGKLSSLVVSLLEDSNACVRSAAIDLILKRQSVLLAATDAARNTPLHVAAQQGDLPACELLVRAGALMMVRNRLRRTPKDLAEERCHFDVVDYFLSRQVIATVRCGSGDAVFEALQDERYVAKVEWFTVPLVGAAGWVGVMHSFLTVTVEDTHSSHCYVIEKAAVSEKENEFCEERLKNGVHISHWADVAPSIHNDAMYTLGPVDILRFGGKTMRMSHLRDVAIGLGPYEVATCNCHHMALAVYNACAKQEAQVTHMPNQVLSWLAGLLEAVGVDVGHSESAALQSDSESRHDRATSVGASMSGYTQANAPGRVKHMDSGYDQCELPSSTSTVGSIGEVADVIGVQVGPWTPVSVDGVTPESLLDGNHEDAGDDHGPCAHGFPESGILPDSILMSALRLRGSRII